MMSWLIDPLPVRQAALLAVWTGLMAVLAVRELSGEPVLLKWPNDLLLDERKLGGIIMDLVSQGGRTRLVAGIGMNVKGLPKGLPQDLRTQAIALPADGRHDVGLSRVGGAILRRWDAELTRFLAEGWASYAEAYRGVDALLGREIVTDQKGTVRGRVLGIDDEGALIIREHSGGERRLLAGDVHIASISRPATDERGHDAAR